MTFENLRYSRQIAMEECGPEGQEKLRQARVTILGAGGLGSPVAIYLAAAGVGNLTIIDQDVVEETNLNRQILHWEKDLGNSKVASAVSKLTQLNSKINFLGIQEKIDESNIHKLLTGSDVVVDCLDNFPTRYLVNDSLFKMGLPFIHGACRGFEGRVSTIIGGLTPCLRCIIPCPPAPEKFPIIGVTAGTIGLFQANETIKLLLGKGDLLTGKLLIYQGSSWLFRIIELEKDAECPTCGERKEGNEGKN